MKISKNVESTMVKDIQAIIIERREALQDLIKASEGVLDLMNTYKKIDGTEEEFNILRVITANAKKIR